MGISSNQARLMTLTARQHDLELRAQKISAEKMIKGLESQEAAMDYSRALQDYTILRQIESLPELPKGEFYYVKMKNGSIISYGNAKALDNGNIPDEYIDWHAEDGFNYTSTDSSGERYKVKGFDLAYEILENTDFLHTYNNKNFSWSIRSIDDNFTSDQWLQIAKSEYDKFTTSLSAEEKLLDMELTQINTEHSAVKTEYDSIKGLVGENVDKSFNVFG